MGLDMIFQKPLSLSVATWMGGYQFDYKFARTKDGLTVILCEGIIHECVCLEATLLKLVV